jgi:hypothetical protein
MTTFARYRRSLFTAAQGIRVLEEHPSNSDVDYRRRRPLDWLEQTVLGLPP